MSGGRVDLVGVPPVHRDYDPDEERKVTHLCVNWIKRNFKKNLQKERCEKQLNWFKSHKKLSCHKSYLSIKRLKGAMTCAVCISQFFLQAKQVNQFFHPNLNIETLAV